MSVYQRRSKKLPTSGPVDTGMGERVRIQFPVWHKYLGITSHPGQLSLAISSRVDAMSTSQTAVTPCSWEVKAGMVRVWVAGITA